MTQDSERPPQEPEEPRDEAPAEERPTEAAPSEAGESEDEDAAARARRFVFKIVPADPKNSFDFEDVADK